jgi:hypothetical protein
MLVVTAFESFNEVEMKAYLLKPHKRASIANGKFWVIRKTSDSQSIIDNLWMFVKDKFFLCIHLMYDPKSLVKSFEPSSDINLEVQIADFVLKSDICIGLLPKRGNASVKSMLKAYKMEDHYNKHMNGSSNYIQKLINC